MILWGSYDSYTHSAVSETEALIGFNSCQVSGLTAELELSPRHSPALGASEKYRISSRGAQSRAQGKVMMAP